MIVLDGVGKHYGAKPVLREVSLTVRQGEVVVVCGPSGSGKSTLIKCVNALEPFQSGTIRVGDVVLGQGAIDERAYAGGWAWCSSTSSSIRISTQWRTCASPSASSFGGRERQRKSGLRPCRSKPDSLSLRAKRFLGKVLSH